MTPSRLTLAQFGLAYVVALLALGLLDGLWLGLIARGFYKREFGSLMADSVRTLPALGFYLLYPAGLVYLALNMPPDGIVEAALRCAVVGLVAYGTYDLSNLATLRGWSSSVTVVDWAWGTVASAASGLLAWWVIIGRH